MQDSGILTPFTAGVEKATRQRNGKVGELLLTTPNPGSGIYDTHNPVRALEGSR